MGSVMEGGCQCGAVRYRIEAHVWTKSRQTWFALPAGVAEFEEQP